MTLLHYSHTRFTQRVAFCRRGPIWQYVYYHLRHFDVEGLCFSFVCLCACTGYLNKKAQLSLTNPRAAKACQKLLQFDVLTTLSLTILHSFSCCCVRNLRNLTKFTENSNLWSSRSSKVIDLGVNRKPMYDFLLVTNSNFSLICYRFRDIDA